MTITHPGTAGASIQHDAIEAASRALAAVSIGAVAPESYAGQLRCQERLMALAQIAFGKVRPDAAAIAAAGGSTSTTCVAGSSGPIRRPQVLRPGRPVDPGFPRSAGLGSG